MVLWHYCESPKGTYSSPKLIKRNVFAGTQNSMAVPRALYVLTRQRRSFLSALFATTAFVSVLTVAGSDVLSCPARSSTKRYAEEALGGERERAVKGRAVIEKRPRRWIEEERP
jgi:cytochrome c oxidase assembly factor 2